MTPGECPYELKTIRVGKQKTCCSLKGGEIWTECREWGKCNWDGYDVVPPDGCDDEPDDSEPEPIEANVSESKPRKAKRSDTEQMRLF